MIKKTISNWLNDSGVNDSDKEGERQEKIRLVEMEIITSRINKKYQELGETVYRNWKKWDGAISRSVKPKHLVGEITRLSDQKKKLSK